MSDYYYDENGDIIGTSEDVIMNLEREKRQIAKGYEIIIKNKDKEIRDLKKQLRNLKQIRR